MVADLGLTFESLYTIQPQYAGQVEIAPGVLMPMQKMPNRFHRWVNRLFFGYTYHDWQDWAN